MKLFDGIQDRLTGQLKTDGCYFLCLVRMATTSVPSYSALTDLYNRAVNNKWMRQDCFVNDPAAIYNAVVGEKKCDGVRVCKLPTAYPCIRCNVKMLKNGRKATHFTVQMSPDVKDVFDPLPPDRPTNVGYSIDSYRELII